MEFRDGPGKVPFLTPTKTCETGSALSQRSTQGDQSVDAYYIPFFSIVGAWSSVFTHSGCKFINRSSIRPYLVVVALSPEACVYYSTSAAKGWVGLELLLGYLTSVATSIRYGVMSPGCSLRYCFSEFPSQMAMPNV